MDESVSHLVHFCHLARSCHLIGPLALRSDVLPHAFPLALQSIQSQLDADQWTEYINSLWAIWRCRNDITYSGKVVGVQEFQSYLSSISWESKLLERKGGLSKRREVETVEFDLNGFEYCCHVDGSWSQGWEAGFGIYLTRKNELVLYKLAKVRACSPFHSEAMALKMAVDVVVQRGITSCIFMSDCKTLVDLVSDFSPPLNADWRAFSLVQSVWNFLRGSESLAAKFISRCHNDLADRLAKMGRVQGWDLTGYTLPMLRDS